MMPHVDGFELTRLLRQDPRTATVSVIILTARGLSADKLEGFAIGADDYIVEAVRHAGAPRPGPRRATARARDRTSRHDRSGRQRGDRGRDRGLVAAGDPFAIFYVDIDRFKSYNDRYGFLRGDEATGRRPG